MFGFFGAGQGFGEAGTLDAEVAFQLDALPGFVLGGVARYIALRHELFEVGLARLRHRHGGLQLGDGFPHGGGFRLATGGLGVELAQLGADVLPLRLQLRLGRRVFDQIGL